MREDGRVDVAVRGREHEPPEPVASVEEPRESLARLERMQREFLGWGPPPGPRHGPLAHVVLGGELDRLPDELLCRVAERRVHERAALERRSVDGRIRGGEMRQDGAEQLLGEVMHACGALYLNRGH